MLADERLVLQAADILFGDYHELHSTAVREALTELEQLRAALGELVEHIGGCHIDPPCGVCAPCRAQELLRRGGAKNNAP